MDLVVAIAAGGIGLLAVGGSIARALRRGVGYQRRVVAAWRAFEAQLGGELRVRGGGALSARPLSLALSVDGVPLVVETTVPLDAELGGHTRVRAAFQAGFGPAFRVVARGLTTPIDAMLSWPTIAVDAPLFDARVLIRSPHKAAVKELLSESARAALLEFPVGVELATDPAGREVTISWDRVETRVEAVERATRLLAELAGYGSRALFRLGGFEGATVTERRPDQLTLDYRSARVVFSVSADEEKLPRYRASVAVSRQLPSFSARIADGRAEGLPEGVLDPERRPDLSRIGQGELHHRDGELRLRFAAAPTSEVGEAAAKVLAAIATGTGRRGAFR